VQVRLLPHPAPLATPRNCTGSLIQQKESSSIAATNNAALTRGGTNLRRYLQQKPIANPAKEFARTEFNRRDMALGRPGFEAGRFGAWLTFGLFLSHSGSDPVCNFPGDVCRCPCSMDRLCRHKVTCLNKLEHFSGGPQTNLESESESENESEHDTFGICFIAWNGAQLRMGPRISVRFQIKFDELKVFSTSAPTLRKHETSDRMES
jgi:hypothetical protein